MNSPVSSKITGAFFIAFGFITLAAFTLLQIYFEYPDILRKGAGYTLMAYKEGGVIIQIFWYAMTIGSVCLMFGSLLLHYEFKNSDFSHLSLLTATGFATGLFNTLGFIRWVFVVPMLAETYANPKSSESAKEAVEIVFNAFHIYFGFSIGEHLGFLFLGIYGIVFSLAMISHKLQIFPKWLGIIGLAGASGTLLGLLEAAGIEAASLGVQIGSSIQIIWVIFIGVYLLKHRWQSANTTTVSKSPVSFFIFFFLILLSTNQLSAQETASDQQINQMPPREISVNLFRNPSMGLEYRQQWLSFHIGFYPTILSTNASGENETTTFIRIGVSLWYLPFDANGSAFYTGVSYVYGLSKDWKDKNGFMFESGARWFFWKGAHARLGVSALTASDKELKIRPNPSVGYALFF